MVAAQNMAQGFDAAPLDLYGWSVRITAECDPCDTAFEQVLETGINPRLLGWNEGDTAAVVPCRFCDASLTARKTEFISPL